MKRPGIFDAHVDTLMRIRSPEEFLQGGGETQLDAPRALQAGITDLVTAVCAEAEGDPAEAMNRGFQYFEALNGRTPFRIHLMLEGCGPLSEFPLRDQMLDRLKMATITWNGSNGLAGGIGTRDSLSAAGRELALELAEKGILIGLSHLCDESRRDILSLGVPVVASHCNCRSLHGHPRNLPDDDIREIAACGGVIGITFVGGFLSSPFATVDDILDHLEHVADVAGMEAAGFGSDFDGTRDLPRGVRDCTVWPDLLEAMADRGWSNNEIEAAAFGNWNRIMTENGQGDQ